MGDGAEGLVDAQARIQDRLDDLEQQRRMSRARAVKDPEAARQLESLQLARKELDRQASVTTHQVRQQQLQAAISDLDKRIASLRERLV
jgi:cell fate (sporulation/competence/biofilm development) regulator YlbF (YheA/YmcA/DUF963 family)